ncbi:MAG: hypothetical protein WDN04_11840 [Rhodospirillales bacterium]
MTGHLGLVAAIDRDAFVPFLFTGGDGAAVARRREAGRIAECRGADAGSVAREGAVRRDPPSGPPPYGFGGQMYWLGWPDKFDYVLITHFGAAVGALPPMLRKVAAGGVADLYQVTAR